jgi:Arc/MetJ family transcription regulator
MKTTLDIPEDVLEDAIKYTGAKTKRDAIVTAVTDFNRRRKLASLADRLGSFDDFLSPQELQDLRSQDAQK